MVSGAGVVYLGGQMTDKPMHGQSAAINEEFSPSNPKQHGASYTPDAVVRSLLQVAVHSDDDRLLDPACVDGRFIAGHCLSVGIEQNAQAAAVAMQRAPGALVHEGEFFTWAANTPERL